MDRPANGSCWFGDGELVDVPARKYLHKPERVEPAEEQDNTTEKQNEEEGDDGSQGDLGFEWQRKRIIQIRAEKGLKDIFKTLQELSSDEDFVRRPRVVQSGVNHRKIGLVAHTSVHESTASVSSSSNPIIMDTRSEIGSRNETMSNEETGLELSSTNLPNLENVRIQNAEGEIVKEEKYKEVKEDKISEQTSSESERKSNLEKLLAIQGKYELHCPRCSSCITRKVILMKKLVDEASDTEEIGPPVKPHAPDTIIEDDVQENKEDGYILACLTCLKYYIQVGVRFLQRDYAKGKPVEEPVEVHLEARKSSNTTERFTVELLKSTVYGGLTETITSLVVVSSASASGSSTENILALTVANLAGGLIVLARNVQDLRNNSDQDKYNELLGRRANIGMHVLVAVLSYIFFGLIAPLVYAFSFYQTGIKNYKLLSVFSVSLICVIMLGMIKVYVRKPVNVRASPKPYLKSAAYYTSIVVVSSGVSYIVGEIVGVYIGKLGIRPVWL